MTIYLGLIHHKGLVPLVPSCVFGSSLVPRLRNKGRREPWNEAMFSLGRRVLLLYVILLSLVCNDKFA